MKFVLSLAEPKQKHRAEELLLTNHCVFEGNPSLDAKLTLDEFGLGIHEPNMWNQPAFYVDFTSMDIRTGAGNISRKQPLARAVGRQSEKILDLTAGFGSDASLLAGMGYLVDARERHPIVYALLQDALDRTAQHPVYAEIVAERIRLQHQEANSVGPSFLRAFDAVYVDPMYPPKKSKAAPPRRAQILQYLAGKDLDQDDLIRWVRTHAKRTVVKRPRQAPPTLEEAPHHQVESKLVRWDVWLNQSSST